MESIEDIISGKPFFQGLSPGNLNLLVNCASKQHVNAGEYILKTGGEAKKFYFIHTGAVSLELHSPEKGSITIQTLEDGEMLGWSWQFPPYKWNFDAMALEDTELIAFDANCFFEKCRINLLFAYEIQKRFSKIMLDRLHSTRLRLLELYSHPDK